MTTLQELLQKVDYYKEKISKTHPLVREELNSLKFKFLNEYYIQLLTKGM